MYVSPSGSGRGDRNNPADLDTATELSRDGGTIICLDGVYTDDIAILGRDGSTLTYQAYTGARPIFVHSDGEPPTVQRKDNTTVTGLWFGGTRPATPGAGRTATNGAGGGFTDCTFFNYENAIQNGNDSHGNLYNRNRLVRCGYESLSHPIYIANLNSSGPGDGCTIEENIIVGSLGGYALHLYHQPSYAVAQYNFCGDSVFGMALQGDSGGPVSGDNNIIWITSDTPLYRSVVTGTCDNNVWNCGALGGTPGDGNYFVDPTPTKGTNPVTWQEADVVSNLGNSSANIDAAISALETSFADSVANIHDDATIETNFAVLKAVIDTWKAA